MKYCPPCYSLQRRSLNHSKLTKRFFCCCEYAGSPTADVPEVAPAMDIPAMLCAQPARSHWCKQEDVERDLGLEHQGISTFFGVQRRLPEGKKRLKEISTKLTAGGVYRFLGRKFPTRVWWLAFTGKGGTEPIFAERGEDNSFRREEDGPREVPVAAPRSAVLSGDKGGSASGVVGEEGDTGAGTTGEGSGVDTGEDSAGNGERCVSELF